MPGKTPETKGIAWAALTCLWGRMDDKGRGEEECGQPPACRPHTLRWRKRHWAKSRKRGRQVPETAPGGWCWLAPAHAVLRW